MKCSVFKLAFTVLIFSAVSHLYSDTVHEVQKGETLYSISKKYGLSVTDLQAANGLSDNGIKIGQKIKIPDGKTIADSGAANSKSPALTTPAPDRAVSAASPAAKTSSSPDGFYTVQKGETWFGISKKYGITVADLQKLNGVGAEASLQVGQKIKVPGGKNSSSSAIASEKKVSESSKKSAEAKSGDTKKSEAKVPDLAKNDPHNYSSKKADSSLVWPVKTENIVYINGKVGGVSLAAKKDEEVKAIRAGTVMFSGSYRGFGNVVFIQSKTGHIYAYTGLGSIDVSKGDYINYSSEIGTAGIDTYTGKSQISLMVFQNGQPIDPAKAPRG
ncbi:MAG: LysM peptidoglycan-binding domain-containing protein [Treponema sp.]|nr:LysM peptidoglycan-binding domain-containing protein [Treponema sp.]